jgi:hypothetical protein
MLATYQGEVYGELSCDSMIASLKIKNSTRNAFYNEVNVTLIPVGDGHTYTWTQSIIAPNIYMEFHGKTIVSDSKNGADKAISESDPVLWAPPCYLVVENFEKVGQVESSDMLRTRLDYNIKLEQHGDNACLSSVASVKL